MGYFFRRALLILFFCISWLTIKGQEPILKIHYLGHSAFVFEFDNGVTVVTDYGKPNAWVQYGWDSPILDIGDLVPTIMSYSHRNHEDHYDPSRIPQGVEHFLVENDTLLIDGLKITPIRVCELNLNVEDNSAFLFCYKGFKFLHLGDAQMQILNINDPVIADHIKDIIPDSLDLLFMTIEGPMQLIEEAETFVDLVKPKRIIPIHYWSQEYLEDFCEYLIEQNSAGKNYQVTDIGGPKYEIYESYVPVPVEVICLTRSEYTVPTGVKANKKPKVGFKLEQNFPNPFNPSTTIKYSVAEEGMVSIKLYNILGEAIADLVDEVKPEGEYELKVNTENLSGGIYFYRLHSGNIVRTRKMVLLK